MLRLRYVTGFRVSGSGVAYGAASIWEFCSPGILCELPSAVALVRRRRRRGPCASCAGHRARGRGPASSWPTYAPSAVATAGLTRNPAMAVVIFLHHRGPSPPFNAPQAARRCNCASLNEQVCAWMPPRPTRSFHVPWAAERPDAPRPARTGFVGAWHRAPGCTRRANGTVRCQVGANEALGGEK